MKQLFVLLKKQQYLCIVLVLSFIAVLPLFHPGLHPTHDGEYHIIRFYEFDKTLHGGDWYPRWAAELNNGHGIALFNYVYPLPNYIASLFHIFGLQFIDTFKAELIASEILGSIFFYLWAKEWWGKKGGAISAVCYAFAPYHFVDIYVRGSVGEAWAICFFPACLWMITKTADKKNIVFPTLAAVFLAMIIFSHNILGLMFFSFSICYGLLLLYLSKEKKWFICSFLYIVVTAIGLSAIFWLPAIVETTYVRGLEIYDIYKNFPEMYELLLPSWGWGFAPDDLANHMSYQIGIANLLAVTISFIVWKKMKKKDKKIANVLVFFIASFILLVFLMQRISYPIWKIVPLLHYFQFPWRLLSLIILITSFLAGSIVAIYKTNTIIYISILVCFLLTFQYTKPPYYMYRSDGYYTSRSNFIDGTNSPGNLFQTKWLQHVPIEKHNKIIFPGSSGRIIRQKILPARYSFTLFRVKGQQMTLFTSYFPGWHVFIDKKEIAITPTKEGFIGFYMPQGKHLLTAKFTNTGVRNVATGISFATMLFMLCFPFVYAKIKR